MLVGEIVRLHVVMFQAGEQVAHFPKHADNQCPERCFGAKTSWEVHHCKRPMIICRASPAAGPGIRPLRFKFVLGFAQSRARHDGTDKHH